MNKAKPVIGYQTSPSINLIHFIFWKLNFNLLFGSTDAAVKAPTAPVYCRRIPNCLSPGISRKNQTVIMPSRLRVAGLGGMIPGSSFQPAMATRPDHGRIHLHLPTNCDRLIASTANALNVSAHA